MIASVDVALHHIGKIKDINNVFETIEMLR